MAIAQGAVDLARGAAQHGPHPDPPAARDGLAGAARPGSRVDDELLDLIADEVNVKAVVVIDDDSALVERRVKPLLPKIGKRLGSAIPAVMAAARAGEVTFEADGSVTLGRGDAGARRGRDPGDAAARHGRRPSRWAGRRPRHDADARSSSPRATPASSPAPSRTCGARRGLELDDRIDLWVRPVPQPVAPHLAGVAADTLADLAAGDPPADAPTATVELDGGPVVIALRRRVADRTPA